MVLRMDCNHDCMLKVIKRITRDNSYGLEPQESGVQDWLLPLSVRYENAYEVI